MRASFLTVSSFALVATAAVAVLTPVKAQDVPVVYRTDPGEAHPRYATKPAPAVQAPSMQVVAEPQVMGQPAVQVQSSAYGARAYQVSGGTTREPVYRTSYVSQAQDMMSVQPGDTVYGIARRYGIRPTDIIAANQLSSPYKLTIGQTLILPGASSAAIQPTPVSIATAAVSPAPLPRAERTYIVRPGDTLFSLSRQFGVDVRTLADANNLNAPYALSIEQPLRIPTGQRSAGQGLAAMATSSVPPSALPPLPQPDVAPSRERLGVQPILVSKSPNARFAWPIRGALLQEYGIASDGHRYDGISIAAPVGAPIRAADDGEVVYTGTELEGYGNLLLISHADGWVSAYAHTDAIIVKKGDKVRQGQVVAKVGNSGGVAQPQLHFELRHDLQPRDPLLALTGQDMLARTDMR